MLKEMLMEVFVAKLKRLAANRPQALRVESSPEVVDGKVDLDALAVVVAGSAAGGP